MAESFKNGKNRNRSISSLLIQFASASIIIYITSLVVPGFKGLNLINSLFVAVIISGLDFLLQRLFNIDSSPFGRGISGFIFAVLTLYLTQFFISGMQITLLGAVLASVVIGVIDAVIPGKGVY